MLALGLLALFLAGIPASIAIINLAILRTPRRSLASAGRVAILIPARNEAATIARSVEAALASTGVPVEVLVGDDHSTDATARIVAERAAADPRLRLVPIPDLPPGWTGKNHACATLAARTKAEHLLFIDADVVLAPEAAARLSAQARRTGTSLLSGVPRQLMESLGERLTVPSINLLLLGYLPMAMMRVSRAPALGAACGQLLLIERSAYAATGGHAAIRASLHDGVRLPRLMRAAGYRTDLVAGHALATCRMYRDLREAWAGFSKNAHEGMATPRALPVWTLLLFGGHVLPWLLVTAALATGAEAGATGLALAAAVTSLATRAAITLRVREPLATIPLHPAIVCVALAIQWNVLLRGRRSGSASWKGRTYPIGEA